MNGMIKGKDRGWILYLAPSMVGFLIFYMIPFFMVIFYSFVDNPLNCNFVGFQNYIGLIKNNAFIIASKNTLIFTTISVPLNMMLSLTAAMILHKSIYFRDLLRSSFILPLIVPVASVVLIWQILFDFHGSLNDVISFLGYDPVDWMNSFYTRWVVVIFYLWKNIGYNMILFLAALQNIPKAYYEAALIDGAGPIRRFIYITCVFLVPTSFFVFIISIINSFKVFREIYLISGNYPYETIYMLQHYMNNMFASLDYQKLSTAAVIMAFIICLIVMGLFLIEKKFSESI